MRTFKWSQSLMIGHDGIDSDHRVLIGLVGDVEEMLEDAAITEKAKETYELFLSFLTAHCAEEESIMRELPDFYASRVAEHCRNHALLIAQAQTVAELLKTGRPSSEILGIFQKAVIAVTRDLIMDDVELVGILLAERRPTRKTTPTMQQPLRADG